MSDGFQSIDLIILAMIAVFLVIRLRSVLGRKDGHENKPGDFFSNSGLLDEEQDNVVNLNGARSQGREPEMDTDDDADTEFQNYPEQVRGGLLDIRKNDPSFHPDQFTEGARSAFEMILEAFVGGDKELLKSLLSEDVYNNFCGVIDDRAKAGETVEDSLIRFKASDIMEAYMDKNRAYVTVKFVTEQINVTLDENNEVVSGSPTDVVTVTDFWTFSRDTSQSDPNWELVATGSLD